MKHAPCKNCTKRYVGCHSKCPDYADWQLDTDNRKKAIQKVRSDEVEVNSAVISHMLKAKRTKGKMR